MKSAVQIFMYLVLISGYTILGSCSGKSTIQENPPLLAHSPDTMIETINDSANYMRIIHKFLFNGFPLFYIGWDPQYVNNEPDEFFEAGFAMLDSSLMWTLNSSTITPQYILSKRLHFIDVIDNSYYLREDQIEFANIDLGCKGGEAQEIIIHLNGPSDDYCNMILGFDAKGDFSVLFDESVSIGEYVKLNDSTLEINTLKRCDFIGYMNCAKKYLFNTITKLVMDVPYEFDKVELETSTLERVGLYSSPSTAIKQQKSSIIGFLKSETKVTITKFLNKDNCYLIKSEGLNGWITDIQL